MGLDVRLVSFAFACLLVLYLVRCCFLLQEKSGGDHFSAS